MARAAGAWASALALLDSVPGGEGWFKVEGLGDIEPGKGSGSQGLRAKSSRIWGVLFWEARVSGVKLTGLWRSGATGFRALKG